MNANELAQARAKRLAELQKQGTKQNLGGIPNVNSAGQGHSQGADEEDEAKAAILAQILTGEARERLARVRIVRGERARGVEDLLIRMAQSGQISRKLGEEDLVRMLEEISDQENRKKDMKIVYERRKYSDDESDEDR